MDRLKKKEKSLEKEKNLTDLQQCRGNIKAKRLKVIATKNDEKQICGKTNNRN